MSNQDDKRWVEALDRLLKRLPDQPAPSTLIPRVMAEIHARHAMPFSRRWWNARLTPVRLIGVTACVVILLAGWISLVREVPNVGFVVAATRMIGDIAYLVNLVANFSSLVLTAILTGLSRAYGVVLLGTTALFLLMYLCCIACGTLLYRLAKSPVMKGVEI
ncbi:MAG: hypothetical protein N3G20_02330 [Verrucomicrobiae bacterium]|nr:hypothetical protein [Verrucomicrobiae bacterium]